MNEVINFFVFYVKWYSDWEEKECESHGIVAAKDWEESVRKIVTRFPQLEDFSLRKLWDDADFIFLSKENYEKVLMDDLRAFDDEVEEEDLADQ